MRVVISRECGQRQAHELLFSLFGIDGATAKELPQNNTEMMGFDAESQQFNYYTLRREGGANEWTFHGSSLDFVIAPGTGEGRECSRCHTHGGLIMKELNAPWVHWEDDTTTPGARELVDRMDDLGTKAGGVNMEGLVVKGNRAWNATRIAALGEPARTELHGGSTAELLRPLFCDTELNLQSTGGPKFGSFGPSPVNGFRGDFFHDPAFTAFAALRFDPAVYQSVLASVGSRIEGISGKNDTFFGFTYVERSTSDVDYVGLLVEQGIVDNEFVKDVLAIDFTRPVFSNARCGLLAFAPTFAELDAPPGGGDTGAETDGSTGDDSGTGGPAKGPCCAVHSTPGCSEPGVEACVCALDGLCCDKEWDQICVNQVSSGAPGCGSCGAPSVGDDPTDAFAGRRGTRALPTSDALRTAMIARLVAADPAKGEPGFQLLVHLQTPDQAASHESQVLAFVQACAARIERDAAALIRDVLTIAALRRQRLQKFSGVLEFPETMVTDDSSPAAGAHLDPSTCELTVD